jgi:hypothetical protein
MLAILGMVPAAHASTPSINNRTTFGCGVAASCSSSIPTTAGDLLIITYQIGDNVGTDTIGATVDGQALTWSRSIFLDGYTCASAGSTNCYIGFFFATAVSTGTDTTVGVTSTHNPNGGFGVQIYDVGPSNLFTAEKGGNTATSTTGTLASTGSVGWTGDVLLVSTVYCPTCTGQNSGAGFTNYGNAMYAVSGVGSPTTFPWTFGTGPTAGGAWGVAGEVFSFSPQAPSSQSQTIGSCPSVNDNTFTMVNSTIYMYEGTTVGPQSVNSISTSVASTIGSGSHTLRLLIYAQQVVGFPAASVSAGFPLIKAYETSYVLTSGTKNSIISAQISLNIGNLAFGGSYSSDIWAVGVVGDDHIKLNQSSLSGLLTQTGAASTSTQPNTFTSAGSASGNKIYLCSTAVYQSILVITTTFSTQLSATTTVTATATTYNIGIVAQGVSNWSIVFLLIMAPAFLLAVGLGAYTRSPQAAGIGLMAGMMIGAGIGAQPQVQLVPPSLFFALVVADLFIMIGIWRFGGGSSV